MLALHVVARDGKPLFLGASFVLQTVLSIDIARLYTEPLTLKIRNG
jgi:uncharacterized protein YfaQ (DUF2300 family)